MRVIETFGPTIQGEGPLAGRVCHFLRLGGCDYRCSWCDTMYAVEPALVRAAENLSVAQILERLAALPSAPLLVISGGNPALHHAGDLVGELRDPYDLVTLETQGSVWRDWLLEVDCLVVSPKPPSSGMATPEHGVRFVSFMNQARRHPWVALKVVVFDATDLSWARAVRRAYPGAPFYLSAGTDQQGEVDPLPGVSARYRWLCEAVTADPELHTAVVLPQLHVIAWGHRVGV